MGLSVILQQPATVEETIELGCLADRCGYDRVFVAETNGPEPLVASGVLAGRTARAELGTAIASVYTRSLPVLAMGAATVARAAGRRFHLGIGPGGRHLVESWHGTPLRSPLARMEEALVVLRALFAGEEVDMEGRTASVRGFRLADGPADVSIMVAATGPAMLSLAGRTADSILLTWNVPESVCAAIERIHAAAAAAERRPPEVIVRILAHLGDGPAEASRAVRASLPWYFLAEPYRRWFAAAGFGPAGEEIVAAVGRRDRQAAVAAVPDELVEMVSFVGSEEGLRRRVADILAGGADSVAVAPLADLGPQAATTTVEGAAAAVVSAARLRSR